MEDQQPMPDFEPLPPPDPLVPDPAPQPSITPPTVEEGFWDDVDFEDWSEPGIMGSPDFGFEPDSVDPLLAAGSARTPSFEPSIEVPQRNLSEERRLQFELYAGTSGGSPVVYANPGTIGGQYCDGYDNVTPIELSGSGDRYVYAKVTIDTSDGTVTARALVAELADPSDPANGVFTLLLGSFLISDGVVQSVQNSNYGPVVMLLGGAVDNKWAAYLF